MIEREGHETTRVTLTLFAIPFAFFVFGFLSWCRTGDFWALYVFVWSTLP